MSRKCLDFTVHMSVLPSLCTRACELVYHYSNLLFVVTVQILLFTLPLPSSPPLLPSSTGQNPKLLSIPLRYNNNARQVPKESESRNYRSSRQHPQRVLRTAETSFRRTEESVL